MFASAKDKIIVALDVSTAQEAQDLINQLSPYAGCFKVGLELTTAIGVPAAVQLVKQSGARVFLDLKLNDIPNTMKKAAVAAENLGVDMLTVHMSAGFPGVKEVTDACKSMLILGVTILTSFDNKIAHAIFNSNIANQVLFLAANAAHCGLGGLICSAEDLKTFPANTVRYKNIHKITPGVRPSWAQNNDQARVMTPADAIQAGSSALVIGRPITQPPQEVGTPADAARRILAEVEQAMTSSN